VLHGPTRRSKSPPCLSKERRDKDGAASRFLTGPGARFGMTSLSRGAAVPSPGEAGSFGDALRRGVKPRPFKATLREEFS
jgi:hypothetical protein